MICAYPKIYNLGHAAIRDLFLDNVVCEEKVDGSQFSFGVIDGALHCRSKGKELDLEHPDKMFALGVATAVNLHKCGLLANGWTYRGEYLSKPKHNTLAYDRVPNGHIIIFDVQTGPETYLAAGAKQAEAQRLGLEHVPVFHYGKVEHSEDLKHLLDRTSILGGQKIEGIVFKSLTRFGVDGKALMGKYVSEAFKEVHRGDWRERNPGQTDLLQSLALKYKTPARWQKAVQHLAEKGELENSPRDIGKLVVEIQGDTFAECEEEIKDALFAWASKHLKRTVVHGFPEWYKEKLARDQFGESGQ